MKRLLFAYLLGACAALVAAERELRQCVYNTYEQWRRRAAKGKKEPAEERSKEQATEQAKEGSCT